MTMLMPQATCSARPQHTPWKTPSLLGVSCVTPVMTHGDPRASRGVMDVYRRLRSVVEEGRGRGQGHGRKERLYRTMAGSTSRPQQLPRSLDNASREKLSTAIGGCGGQVVAPLVKSCQ